MGRAGGAGFVMLGGAAAKTEAVPVGEGGQEEKGPEGAGLTGSSGFLKMLNMSG